MLRDGSIAAVANSITARSTSAYSMPVISNLRRDLPGTIAREIYADCPTVDIASAESLGPTGVDARRRANIFLLLCLAYRGLANGLVDQGAAVPENARVSAL